MSFHDQVVLITGATGEFGPNVARAFAAEGARLALTGRKAEAAAELAKEIGLGDDRALAVAADVTNADSVAALGSQPIGAGGLSRVGGFGARDADRAGELLGF